MVLGVMMRNVLNWAAITLVVIGLVVWALGIAFVIHEGTWAVAGW
jgi:hypothetical protein